MLLKLLLSRELMMLLMLLMLSPKESVGINPRDTEPFGGLCRASSSSVDAKYCSRALVGRPSVSNSVMNGSSQQSASASSVTST